MPSYPSGALCGAVHCSAAIGHRHRRATLQARQCRRPMTAGVAITLIVVRSCEVITCLGLLAAVPAPPKKGAFGRGYVGVGWFGYAPFLGGRHGRGRLAPTGAGAPLRRRATTAGREPPHHAARPRRQSPPSRALTGAPPPPAPMAGSSSNIL